MEGTVGRGSQPLLEGAVLIAGPTASGKSQLAIRIAEALGGAVVNADSMQVYDVLNVLTARPDADDLERVPHHLFGHVAPGDTYSTGRWLRDVDALVRGSGLEERPAVFVGGTGLYFRALLGGLSQMPAIPQAVRDAWRQRLAEEGPAALHRALAAVDPQVAATLHAGDGQRILRALEVLDATGRSIAHWRSEGGRPLVDSTSACLLVLEPDRAALRARIDLRFDAMLENGAIEEVRALNRLHLDPSVPAMRAIGVRELASVLSRRTTLADAVARAKIATAQYAKRQATWFRNQLAPDWKRIYGFGEEADAHALATERVD
jgi:tRNA dimethylallyltransferase